MKQTLSVARKEIAGYFGSPMALIFLGAFLAATLFAFFWVDTFFARGIADVRPLFRWLPVMLIFLVAALTMRQWSEEQHSGTLEMLLTLPIRAIQLVLGKFLAVLALVGVALALTFPLPITVAFLGDLDWGPVIGGYLAAILLAGAYAALGLFVSSRTDNQIVALISTALLGGLIYLIGTGGVTDFVGGNLASLFRALGTGSRFESIERGVIDLRDLVYYLSLTGLFLLLNALSLDMKRWSHGARTRGYRRNATIGILLAAANLVLLNVWLQPLAGLRVDLTEQRAYSLSDTTKQIVGNLAEPLLIRAYISKKTHPLLAPLRPQIQDMLREYAIASKGKITAEVVDPLSDPQIEAEAGQTYGIRPTPFQVSGRYEASVINSYFDILVRYGDQTVTLNFRDLIEVEPRRDGTLDVHLRNLEYDLTRAVKKAVYGFQSVDAALASLESPASLTLYATPDTLPKPLADAPDTIRKVAESIQEDSQGKFRFQVVNPDEPGSSVTREKLFEEYGLRPIAASLFADRQYYLYMVLQVGNRTQVVNPSGDFSEASIRTAIESALKRSTSGFLKVVGLWTPPATPKQGPFGRPQQPFSSWNMIEDQLRSDYSVRQVDLKDGSVPADVDVLLVLAPQNLTDKERFAIDQFLMRGGSLVVAGGRYTADADAFTGTLKLNTVEGDLRDVLELYGVKIGDGVVMDPQNAQFPLPVTRSVAGFQVREIRAINYPFFVDVRPDGMDRTSPITANLPAVTAYWSSPVELDADKNENRETHVLLKSTAASWIRTKTDIQPDFQAYPGQGFAVADERKAYPLAVSVQGEFESFFKGKPSPLETAEASDEQDKNDTSETSDTEPTAVGVIERSPSSARLIVIGSSEIVDDPILRLASALGRDRHLDNLQFIQNAVDWSVEDLDLLTIRARGTRARVLKPMEDRQETIWEVGNYAVALLALVVIGGLWYWRRQHEKPIILTTDDAEPSGV